MIKSTATLGDRTLLMIGLSFGNLDKPALSADTMPGGIGPDTKVHIDPKLKS